MDQAIELPATCLGRKYIVETGVQPRGTLMGIKKIEADIKKLDLRDRAALAKWIVESLDDLSESEVAALWAEEAERRLDEMERGQVKEIPAKEVLRRARASIA
jgi:hypothetical protein